MEVDAELVVLDEVDHAVAVDVGVRVAQRQIVDRAEVLGGRGIEPEVGDQLVVGGRARRGLARGIDVTSPMSRWPASCGDTVSSVFARNIATAMSAPTAVESTNTKT